MSAHGTEVGGKEAADAAAAAPLVGAPLAAEAELRRWRVVVWALLFAIVCLTAALALTWRRAAAFDALVDEHLALQARLVRLDQTMAEVDRILLRLRLYDAQLETLGGAHGEAGPFPEGTHSNAAFEAPVDGLPDTEGWSVVAPDEAFDVALADHLHDEPGIDRAATAWAEALEARTQTFLSTIEAREPGLSRFMGELEGLGALERALPSHMPAKAVLTSGYGWRRNPFGRRWLFHSGIDLGGAMGDPIFAAAQGKVITADVGSSYGKYLEIDHGFGVVTLYAHCSRLLVKAGDVVQRGQTIARMGSTGRSTGPHLHFEVRLDGNAVDPLDYFRKRRKRASPAPSTPGSTP